MYSISGNNWEETFVSKRIIDKVKNDLNFSEVLSKLIISRKFNQTEIDSINNNIEIFNPFTKNKDFENGQKIIEEIIKKDQKTLIIGDYDVDGCVATSLFVNFFKSINKKIDFYIPNRFSDGYGPNISMIKKLIKKKPKLIIMVDCGSNSVDIIKFLKSKNIETIIIDHHEIYKPYPNLRCLINPKKECDYNKYDYLCASTLVYFFIDHIIKKNKFNINFKNNLIYVLLATICDVMPLRKINRIIAINVLKKFEIKKNYLFDRILTLKKINRPLEINDLGFLIGPIINSSGRLGDANIVVDLITNKNTKTKDYIINKLIKTNEKRKKIEDDFINKVDLAGINKIKDNVLVEYQKDLSEGIIGIIASRFKDYFNKPSIILTKSNDIYKASARSTSNFNIGKYIKQAIDKKIIIKGGGHNLAAGFSIKKNKINEFKTYINNIYSKNSSRVSKEYLSKISLSAVNSEFYSSLNIAGPFGSGNINPIFLLENITIIKPTILKKKIVSFYVKSKFSKLFPAISFGALESEINQQLLNNKNEMNLIVQIKENLWNNKKSLQLIVLDLITDSNNA